MRQIHIVFENILTVSVNRKKKYFLIISLGLLILVIWQHELLFYGFQQLKGQLHIIYHAKPIAEILEDPETPQVLKEKLLLINHIKSFAIDSLGLKPTANYSTLYNQHDQPVLWVLTACNPFKFEPKTWWFPITGEVTYKGFFDQKKGESELKKLRLEGFDADLSPTGGWSTLGWFKDPVLSNMLKKNEGTLAELIIHELLHATCYLKNNVDFNENLATFVGEQGAISYLNFAYGDSSNQLTTYLQYKADEELFGNYMINSQKKLEDVYLDFAENESYVDKLKVKKRIIRDIIKGLDTLPFYNKKRYHYSTAFDSLPDNTFFMSNYRYRNNQKQLTDKFNLLFNNNLDDLIYFLKNQDEEIILNRLNR